MASLSLKERGGGVATLVRLSSTDAPINSALNYGGNLARSECILRCNLPAARRSNSVSTQEVLQLKRRNADQTGRSPSDWSRSMGTNELLRFN